MKQLVLTIQALILTLCCVQAQYNPFEDSNDKPAKEEKTSASLHSAVKTTAPGETFTVAIKLTHAEGWHAYYKNPGGVGLPLEFEWVLPKGFSLTSEQWPTPHLYENQGNTFYTYSGEYLILAEISSDDTVAVDQDVQISVTANWQICDEKSCLNPESKKLNISLPVENVQELNQEQKALFDEARKELPVPSTDWNVSVSDESNQYLLHLTPSGSNTHELSDLYFFSSAGETQNVKKQKLTKEGDLYTLALPKNTDYQGDPVKNLSGVIYSSTGWSSGASNTGLIIDKVAFEKAKLKSASIGKLLGIIGGMLLGGLILNLMPCVFPVIGLKIMGFAEQAGAEKKKVVFHGLTFASGVLISFWVMSGLLLTLRNAALKGEGQEVGWGYQLQNPYVVFAILLLMFILALNMFGVFELGTKVVGVGGELQNKSGLAGSFFSGVLATVVATPCSAPFLGAAIGAAFALPNVQFMLAFTAMALGLALPYLFLSIFPDLIKKLPRPGPWMESFKQGMSFLLFATAGYLLWVYVSQTGLDYMLNIVIGLSVIALALWIYGRWNLPYKSKTVQNVAKALTLLGLIGGISMAFPPNKSNKITWEKWSNEEVERLLENDTPVFVDFTATWCATCQVNKKRAYSKEVVKLFKEYGIVALKADKTNASPEIERKLQELGRTAIPVNVLYVPGSDDPIITPELLTSDYMVELINTQLSN